MRRSFQFGVAACVAFTSILWIAEKYARYDLIESQYIMSLTLPTESARAVLRNVVKRDAQAHEQANAKYATALAEREDKDSMLPAYEKAWQLDPNNAALAMEYGCVLFLDKKYADARERFREAAVQAKQYAMPRYLEAAAAAFAVPASGTDDKPDIAESVALVAKANVGESPVEFPPPLWSSHLPLNGASYQKLRRQLVDLLCAPLYRYKDMVLTGASKTGDQARGTYWDGWLETIETMGAHIAVGGQNASPESVGAVQMTAGLTIEMAAIDARLNSGKGQEVIDANEKLTARRNNIRQALGLLADFEGKRDTRIASAKDRYFLPLNLAWRTLALLEGAFLAAWVLSMILRAPRACWALPHSTFAKVLLAGAAMGWCGLLCSLLVWQQRADPLVLDTHDATSGTLLALWWILVLAILAIGPTYAVVQSRRNRGMLRALAHLDAVSIRLLLAAGANYLRRYYAVAWCLFLCVLCVWTIVFRIATHLYPWEVELLASGLALQESEMINSLLRLLR